MAFEALAAIFRDNSSFYYVRDSKGFGAVRHPYLFFETERYRSMSEK